jgi:hypothetical protein
VSEVRYRKSSLAESHRWGAYLERRNAALWKQPRLRAGLQLGIFPAFTAQQCWTVEYTPARGEQAEARFARCDISLDYQRFLAMSPDDQASMHPLVERSAFTVGLQPAMTTLRASALRQPPMTRTRFSRLAACEATRPERAAYVTLVEADKGQPSFGGTPPRCGVASLRLATFPRPCYAEAPGLAFAA